MPVLAVVTWSLFGLGIFTKTVVAMAVIAGGTMMYQRQSAKSAASKQRKSQQAAAEAQAKSAGRQRAIGSVPISAAQMEMVISQREVENIVDKFTEQDQTEPEIYTLPAIERTSPIERINLAIEDFFRK